MDGIKAAIDDLIVDVTAQRSCSDSYQRLIALIRSYGEAVASAERERAVQRVTNAFVIAARDGSNLSTQTLTDAIMGE